MTITRTALGLAFALSVSAIAGGGTAAQPIDIEMSAERWEVPAGTLFEREEGFPNGRMTLKSGFAILREGGFSSGVVEFDMKALEFSDTGIQFRRKDADTAEFLYLRADPDCPAANDCIQYAPITHGLMQWDIYPRFQGQAPVSEKGWNHVKLVVAGSRLRVFVNREAFPSLEVDRLQGLADSGGIAFKGPAVFANLRLRPGETGDMPGAKPPVIDPRLVSHWLVTAPTPAPATRDPSLSDMPAGAIWKRLDAEVDGLANLSRELGPTPEPALAWLKTSVQADRDLTKTVSLGWAREIWVFLNGSLVYAGKNPYYPSDKRLGPDGRLAPDNAKIALALRKGDNDIVIAVGNKWQTHQGVVKASPYGWGVTMAYADLANIRIASESYTSR